MPYRISLAPALLLSSAAWGFSAADPLTVDYQLPTDGPGREAGAPLPQRLEQAVLPQMWLRMTRIVFVWLSAGIGLLGGVDAPAAEQKGGGEGGLELTVHVCQANNNSPYTFVRAKFEPGEVPDPWAVRFVDKDGAEVPYFVGSSDYSVGDSCIVLVVVVETV